MSEHLVRAWLRLSVDEKSQWHGVGLCAALFLLHFALYSTWFIEDAAITFAFARNAATGEGLVAYPGGEPVEGFSNPSWTLLLAATRLLGISPWIAAKLFGALLGVATLPLAYLWGRRLLPREAGRFAVLVPLMLAVTPQFVQWCASGLENALFGFLLTLGAVLLIAEEAEARTPWSALPFFLLAITRPEAPLYAAVAGFLGLVFIANNRGGRAAWRWAWQWGALFGAPFAAFHALRFAYFAWELPNTYYAKLVEGDRFQPLKWGTRGWRYLRSYALSTGQGFLLPIYVLGQTGLRGLRGITGLSLALILLALLLPGLTWTKDLLPFWPAFDEPEWFVALRVVGLATLVLLAPGVGLERRGDMGRVLAWFLAFTALFFALYTGGDWMDGYRWLSMGIVPIAVLYIDGVHAVVRRLGGIASPVGSRRWRFAQGVLVVLIGTPLVIGAVHSGFRIGLPETGPYDVGRRVTYMQGAADRLHMDRVSLLEVDMGAHMWFSGFELVDMAGLVDVPMGHHRWEKPFVKQYVYEERQPDFAHVHGGWASRTRMASHRDFMDYVEIEPYPVGPRTQHAGNHVHKRLFVGAEWEGTPGREVRFTKGLTLAGWEIPAPEVAAGQSLYVELGWQRRGIATPFRAWLFLSAGDRLVVWEIPPAYDWLELRKWRRGEVIFGRHSLPLPSDLEEGSYDLGLVLVGEGEKGHVIGAAATPGVSLPDDPRLARGEVRWSGVVEVVPESVAMARAADHLARALQTAASGDCGQADVLWTTGRRFLAADHRWQASASRAIAPALARCYVDWAEALGPHDGLEAAQKARRWDHRDLRVRAGCGALADRLVAEGDMFAEAGDDAGAYAAWRDALSIDPRRTWVRRRAEGARDRVLELEAKPQGG
ncbi:MAG: hypothetical protein JRJ84_15070 [Deltaproteobacteria bacterium]|nr:hypothetical protein [Deltaproteobacteria bacterium]